MRSVVLLSACALLACASPPKSRTSPPKPSRSQEAGSVAYQSALAEALEKYSSVFSDGWIENVHDIAFEVADLDATHLDRLYAKLAKIAGCQTSVHALGLDPRVECEAPPREVVGVEGPESVKARMGLTRACEPDLRQLCGALFTHSWMRGSKARLRQASDYGQIALESCFEHFQRLAPERTDPDQVCAPLVAEWNATRAEMRASGAQ